MSHPNAASLTCPKCRGAMRTYERSSVHVDQCTECRGIFLDRGELERLVDAESAFYQPQASNAAPMSRNFDHGRHGSQHGKHKRGGFLSELFD